MSKKLSEMTLEELWMLFPVILEEHKDHWAGWFEEERAELKKILPKNAKISHIGSTAVKNIRAKPIVDILVEIESGMDGVKDILINNGYICMSEKADGMSFNKGYTESGFAEKVFHLHLRCPGDNDEIYFRDYLIENPDIAKEYEKLKMSLQKQFEHNRDEYTNQKTEFVKKYTREAKERKIGFDLSLISE
ncbi:MAG: GrpB family protein [Oscillospiraceae bacterium]|nr:GrpB family protein [Oscillospiraceae bacterium]